MVKVTGNHAGKFSSPDHGSPPARKVAKNCAFGWGPQVRERGKGFPGKCFSFVYLFNLTLLFSYKIIRNIQKF